MEGVTKSELLEVAGDIKKSHKESLDFAQKELKRIETDVNGLIERVNKQLQENGQTNEDTKTQLTKALETWNTKHDEMQKRIDQFQIDRKKAFGSVTGDVSFKQALFEGLENSREVLKSRKMTAGAKIDHTIDLHGVNLEKAMDSATNLTPAASTGFVIPDERTGIIGVPQEPVRVRSYLASGTTSSDTIRYVKYSGRTGDFETVAEGALKPEIKYSLTKADAPVRKIAAYLRLPEEMIDDVPYLTSFITSQATEDLAIAENEQIIAGTGVDEDLLGLIPSAVDFSVAGTTFADYFALNSTNYADILRIGINQIRLKHYYPTNIFMNPTDVAVLELEKDNEGRYLFPFAMAGQGIAISRVPVVEVTTMPSGEALVGNFRLAAQVVDRKMTSVRFYDQNQDDPIRNTITIVVEKRLALPVYRPDAMVHINFATAKGLVEAAA